MHILIAFLAVALLVAFFLYSRRQAQAPALPPPASEFERDIRAQDFDDMVLANSARLPVLVDFYARWCGPCHHFAPVLADVTREYGGAFLLARVDYDQSRDLVKRYGVQCVPTVALFRNGERVDGFEGGQLPHQLRYFLGKNGIQPP